MKRLIILLLVFCLTFTSSSGLTFSQTQGSVALPKGQEIISVDLRGVDIGDALRLLAKQHDINIILSQDVAGVVTIQFSNVTVDEAIDAIVTTNGFAYTKLENVYKVTSPDEAEPSTRIFRLNNASAEELRTSFQRVLSAVGSIEVDARSNSIIVTDLPAPLITIEKLVVELDSKTPQIKIEAKLIETVLGRDDNLGIDWTMKASAVGASRPSTVPFVNQLKEDDYQVLPKSLPTDVGSVGVFPAMGTNPNELTGYQFAFPYAVADDFVMGTLNFTELQMVVELLKSRSKTNLLSAPSITTLNNREASVTIGTKIPIPLYERNETTGSMEVTGYDEQDVGITLIVTPNVSPGGDIRLTLHPEVSSIIGYTGPNNERPIVSTREADTQVQIKDGETVVIGGLIKEEEVKSVKRVPILGYIPILGFPFQKTVRSMEKTDLLIFVTAHILSDEKKSFFSYEAMKKANRKDIFRADIEGYLDETDKPFKAMKKVSEKKISKKMIKPPEANEVLNKPFKPKKKR